MEKYDHSNIHIIWNFYKNPEVFLHLVLDLNSKFEKSPGIKDVELLKEFLKELRD